MTKPDLRALALLMPLLGCGTPVVKPTVKTVELQTDQQQSSYAQGVKYMQNLQRGEIPLNQDLFVLGLNDVLEKRPLRLTAEQLQKGQDWVFVQHVLYTEKLAAANKAKSEAFLQQNRQQPGVMTTASGLQYQVLASGQDTGVKPGATDSVRMRYRISRLDGSELTASNPDTAPEAAVAGLVKGWQEALALMNQGAKWRLFVPPELAYGEDGMAGGKVEPNEALIYEVELLEVKPGGAAAAKPKALVAAPNGDLKPTSSWPATVQ